LIDQRDLFRMRFTSFLRTLLDIQYSLSVTLTCVFVLTKKNYACSFLHLTVRRYSWPGLKSFRRHCHSQSYDRPKTPIFFGVDFRILTGFSRTRLQCTLTVLSNSNESSSWYGQNEESNCLHHIKCKLEQNSVVFYNGSSHVKNRIFSACSRLRYFTK
jgi:hypothetical protein